MQTLATLAELGITVYRRRALMAAVQPVPAIPQQPRPLPQVPTSVTASSEPPVAATVLSMGLSMALPGAQGTPRLRAHLLLAARATEAEVTVADVVFGGRGRLLALPSAGALAANPQLKRQAWQALRALRRHPRS